MKRKEFNYQFPKESKIIKFPMKITKRKYVGNKNNSKVSFTFLKTKTSILQSDFAMKKSSLLQKKFNS